MCARRCPGTHGTVPPGPARRPQLTLHGGEVPGRTPEALAMLAMQPERLGHMCCMEDAVEAQLLVRGGGWGARSVQCADAHTRDASVMWFT